MLLYTIRNEADNKLVLQTELPEIFQMWVDHKVSQVKQATRQLVEGVKVPSDIDTGILEALHLEELALDRIIEMSNDKASRKSKKVCGAIINGYNILITSAIGGF